jgi:hypothetical protein
MGLSAQDRQALDVIEGRLADAEPRLASMLATFTRLTAEEAMPARESISPGRRRSRRAGFVDTLEHDWPRGERGRAHIRSWRRKALALWFVITLALVGAAILAIHVGGRVCPSMTSTCASQAPAGHPKSRRTTVPAVTHRSGRATTQTSAARP